MATGLEIFGVACNVMQTIHFAMETVSICKMIHGGVSPAPEMESRHKELRQITESLQKCLKQLPGDCLQDDDNEIRRVAAELVSTADDLGKELAKYEKGGGTSRGASFLRTTKFVIRKPKIAKLDEKLQSYQKVMETRVLFRLSKRTDLIQTALSTHSDNVNDQLGNFLRLLKDGHLEMAKLVQDSTGKIQSDVRNQGMETRDAMENVIVSESTLTRLHISSVQDTCDSNYKANAQIKDFLQSIKYPEMFERLNAGAISQPHEGTFNWIFEEKLFEDTYPRQWDCFRDWLNSDNKGYWISGKPGAGKSSLIRYLTNDPRTKTLLQKGRQSNDVRILRAFMWNAGKPIQRSQKGLLATLIYELVSHNENAALYLARTRTGKDSINDWSLSELLDSLLQALALDTTPVCIFIDGLDEVDTQEFDGLQGLLKLLKSMREMRHVKLCLGSRPEPIFAAAFAHYPQLRLQDLTRGDILKYVKDSLSGIQEHSVTENQLTKLSYTIVDQSGGVFLWVNLVTKSILRGLISYDDWDLLLARVNKLPSDLVSLYKEMWNRLNNEDKELYSAESALCFRLVLEYPRLSLFQMLLCAKPKLRRELFEGGHEIKEEYLISQCLMFKKQLLVRSTGLLEIFGDDGSLSYRKGSFLEICPPSASIHFIHRSASDFFKDTLDGQSILQHDKHKGAELRLWAILASFYFRFRSLRLPGEEFLIQQTRNELSDLRALDAELIALLELKLLDFIRVTTARAPILSKSYESFPFVKIAAWAGYKTYAERYIESLSSHDSAESLLLKSELLAWACRGFCGSWPSHTDYFGGESYVMSRYISTANLISFLLDSNINSNLSSPDFKKTLLPDEDYYTPFVAFLLSIPRCLSLTHPSVAALAEQLLFLLYKFLDNRANIEGRVLVQLGSLPMTRWSSITPWTSTTETFNPFSEPSNVGNERILVEVDVWQLVCYIHKKVVQHIEQHLGTNSKVPSHMKHLESKPIALPRTALITFYAGLPDQERPSSVLKSIHRTPQSRHAFEHIDNFLASEVTSEFRALKFNLSKTVSDLEALPGRSILNDHETIEWLIDHGYIPHKMMEMDYSPKKMVFIPSEIRDILDYRSSFHLERLDWTYSPAYEELLEAVRAVSNPVEK